MNQKILEIFERNCTAINYFEWANECFKFQDNKSALSYIEVGMEYFVEIINLIISKENYFKSNNIFNIISLNEILSEYLRAQEVKNYILVMNSLVKKILPFIYSLQNYIISKENNFMKIRENRWDITSLKKKNKELYEILNVENYDEEGIQDKFSCLFSSAGAIMANYQLNDKLIHLHSNISPFLEAFKIVNKWNDQNKSKYIVYGLGLGYHVVLLLCLNSELTVDVYDNNLEIIKLTKRFGSYNIFNHFKNLNIIYDPDFTKLESNIKNMCENTKFVVYYPALNYIEKKEHYDKLINLIKIYNVD